MASSRAFSAASLASAAEKARLEATLADPALYAPGKAADVTTANQRLATIARETRAAELRWLEAAQALEDVE